MRPKKYSEESKMISFRVPDSRVDEIRELVYGQLKRYEVHGENDKPIPVKEKVVDHTKPKWQLDAEERLKRKLS